MPPVMGCGSQGQGQSRVAAAILFLNPASQHVGLAVVYLERRGGVAGAQAISLGAARTRDGLDDVGHL